MKRTACSASIALTVMLLACGLGDAGEPTEVAAQRQAAASDACIAEELLRRADEGLDMLEASYQAGGEDAAGPLRQAAASALRFAEVYHQHAELRNAFQAHVDSAANHSRRQADSVRYAGAAQAYLVRRPEAGSIEDNALQNYLRDFRALRADADHPCNWAIN